MKRIDSVNARPDVNGTGKAGFHANDDVPGQDATYLTPDFLNTIQEELANLLELRGITLDPEKRDQLFNALAGKDDVDAALDTVQTLLDNERNARIKADQDHLDALNPHPQYVMRKDFRLLYRTLTPETTINPKIYTDDPQNWQIKHTVENISAHIMPNGVIAQTVKVRTVYGDYNAQVYLPIGISNILNVSSTYQGQRENQDAEDDSAIRLLDIYDEIIQLENGLQECRTVVNFRFDYVSGNNTPGQRERFAYLEITGFGASNTDLENLNSYPYPYYRNQDDLDGQVVYVDQNLTNVSLLELFIQTYGAPTATTRAIFVIASGVTLIAVTSGSWLDGSSRQIINYGHIYGTGGSGGYYDENTAMVGDGGTAIIAQNASSFIDVRNYGLIAGGGGGGAAGKSEYSIGAQDYYAVGAGGGGIPLGTGGVNINQTVEGKTLVNLAGEAATLSVAGNGATGTGLAAGGGGNVGEDGKASESTLDNGIVGKAGFIYQGNVTITNIGGGQIKGRLPSI
ncbi:TPA: phage tail protein [Acinetobacter baumannii]|nr:phage tail protein [Acinetobacter baumannii]